MHQAQAPTGQGHGNDADQNRAEHAVVAEDRNQQKAHRRQQRCRLVQRPELDQGGRAVDDDAGGFQADHPKKQTDPGAHGMPQADRDAVEQPLADARQRQQHKQHPGDKHCTQGGLPVIAHGADHGVGEKRIQAHARRQAHRPVGVQAHQQATEGGGDAGGDKGRTVIDAGIGHDVGVDEDDVGHGDKGGEAGDQLGLHCGAMHAQFEQTFQPTALGGG